MQCARWGTLAPLYSLLSLSLASTEDISTLPFPKCTLLTETPKFYNLYTLHNYTTTTTTTHPRDVKSFCFCDNVRKFSSFRPPISKSVTIIMSLFDDILKCTKNAKNKKSRYITHFFSYVKLHSPPATRTKLQHQATLYRSLPLRKALKSHMHVKICRIFF